MQSPTTTSAGKKNFPGRKGLSGHLQQIISHVPHCDTFIDVMSGSGVISDYCQSLSCVVVRNDYDGSISANENLHYQDPVAKYDCAAGSGVISDYCQSLPGTVVRND